MKKLAVLLLILAISITTFGMSSRHFRALLENPEMYRTKPFDVMMLVEYVLLGDNEQEIIIVGRLLFDQDQIDVRIGKYHVDPNKYALIVADRRYLKRVYVKGDVALFEDMYFDELGHTDLTGDMPCFLYTRDPQLTRRFNLSGSPWDQLLYTP